jgi:hypothetical protein
MKDYQAPWSTSLIVITSLTTLICLGIPLGMILFTGSLSWSAALPPVILLGSAFFAIRGYSITADEILVQRLFWVTQLPRTGLESAQFVPDAMRQSIRTCGNGGCFSFSGYYRNETLGPYRAFVTDPHRTVVLRYPEKTIVLSPDRPEEFIRDLAMLEISSPSL